MIRFARERKYSFTGSAYRPVYKLKISDVTGAEELVQIGKEDFNAYIQSFAEQCDLNVIISRVNAGEVDLLTKNVGVYGDFRNMPKTKAEAMQQLIDAKATWDSLTDKQRSEFDGFSDFAATAGDETWLKKLGFEIPVKDVTIEKEVNQDAES